MMENKNITQESFPILGMSCASCAARVDKALNHQPGVSKAAVNYASGMATVEYDPSQCSPEALKQAVQAAGYDLLIQQGRNTLEEAEQAHDKNIARSNSARHGPSSCPYRLSSSACSSWICHTPT